MDLRRASFLIATLLLAGGLFSGPAAGQGFTPAPSQGFGPPPGGVQPAAPNPFDAAPRQEPPCFKEFLELKAETEKRGKAVQMAGQRKAHPAEACKLFNSLMAAEVKFIKFVDENVKSCGIPPQVPMQLKENHTKVKQVRDRVCQIASQPHRPAGPSLSDALGTSHLPDSSNIKTGRGGGTFDTLTNTTPQR